MERRFLLLLFIFVFTSLHAQNNLREYEYWFDEDYLNRIIVVIPPTESLNLVNGISTAPLDPGLHVLHIRFKDDSSRYSSVLNKFFQKFISGASKFLTTYEYWFDNDYANKVVNTFPTAGSLELMTSLATTSLSEGVHRFYIRFQDTENMWSSVTSQFFYKGRTGSLITAYRYWMDDDFNNVKLVSLPTPVSQFTLTPSISLGVPDGNSHELHIQFQELSGQWSSICTETIAHDGTGLFPSWISIQNVIENNLAFPDPNILWEGNLNFIGPLSPIKICADGSKATKIVFENNTGVPNEDILITTESYQSNPVVDSTGYFDPDDSLHNGNTLEWYFTHPNYMDAPSLSRSGNIRILDASTGNQILYEIPIEVYRAPILLIHGAFGNPENFRELSQELLNGNIIPPQILKLGDYECSSSQKFSVNQHVLGDEITKLFKLGRKHYFSFGKADIVAHSMGGIISRVYLQMEKCGSNSFRGCYREDIHKFITIGTPHFGTQFANVVNSIPGKKILNYPLNLLFTNSCPSPFKIQDGAVNDLQIDSDAMKMWLNGSHLNQNFVPTHTITTNSLWSNAIVGDESWDTYFIQSLARLYAYDTPQSFIDWVFINDPNDIVVPVPSQDGGLIGASTINFPNQKHLGQTRNSFVKDHIKTLLRVTPNSSGVSRLNFGVNRF